MSRGVIFDNNSGPVTVINEKQEARSTILGKLIEIIASAECESMNLDRIPAEIEHKIQFNDLKSYQWLIDEYVSSSLLIDKSILQLNQTILNGSTRLKRQMKIFYLKSLGKYSISTKPFDLEKLKTNSDGVIQEVIYLATKFVNLSSDLKDGYFSEDIEYGVTLLTSYSIIECIVLENPNDHD
jgi:hypothetical protein